MASADNCMSPWAPPEAGLQKNVPFLLPPTDPPLWVSPTYNKGSSVITKSYLTFSHDQALLMRLNHRMVVPGFSPFAKDEENTKNLHCKGKPDYLKFCETTATARLNIIFLFISSLLHNQCYFDCEFNNAIF